jgi:hypothetical protein
MASILNILRNRYYLLLGFLFFILAFVVYYFSGESRETAYHYFAPLAEAFLDGRLYLLTKPSWLNELLPVDGKYYVIYPPIPAILLIPQALLSGPDINQTLASVFWGALSISVVYFLMRRLTESIRLQIWMTLLLAFGTIFWYLACDGKAWFFAQVASFFFLTLAVFETFGKKRPLLIGVLLGLSFWCRLPVILSLPFFLIMLSDQWINRDPNAGLLKKINIRPLIMLGLGVGIFVILNFIYNYIRFDTIANVAYTMQAMEEPWFYPKGLFHISYILKHLYVFFLKPPLFSWDAPYVIPSLEGMSILITTPAVIYAAFAGIRNKTALACWSAIIPVAMVSFTHGGYGWIQFGYRFAVDFYPFLLVLITMGMNSLLKENSDLRWHQKLLIILSILVNTWGILWINKFGWSEIWG